MSRIASPEEVKVAYRNNDINLLQQYDDLLLAEMKRSNNDARTMARRWECLGLLKQLRKDAAEAEYAGKAKRKQDIVDGLEAGVRIHPNDVGLQRTLAEAKAEFGL